MIKFFRIVSLAEGCSLLLLLLIAMPLKYFMNYPVAVKVVGWIHGVLFIAYVAVLVVLQIRKRWSLLFFLGAFGASLLPFGTFFLDKYLREKEAEAQA
jgi:integral membrane protein